MNIKMGYADVEVRSISSREAEGEGAWGTYSACEGIIRIRGDLSPREQARVLLHDPQFRRVRREDLVEVGRRIRLKRNIALLSQLLANGVDGHRFDFYVVSAAPEDVVNSALGSPRGTDDVELFNLPVFGIGLLHFAIPALLGGATASLQSTAKAS